MRPINEESNALADKSGKPPRNGSPLSGTRTDTSASALGPSAGSTATSRVVVPLEDNRIVPLVLGEHDAHLALIEQLIGVKAVAHGNVISISGPEAACATAKKVLEALYARAVRGEDFTAGDVEGIPRPTHHSSRAPAPVARRAGTITGRLTISSGMRSGA